MFALTCWGFKVGLLLLLDGLRVIVGCAFVHGECWDLLVGFPTMVTVVRFAGCMDHMVFVKAGVFCEALFAARHCTHIRFLSWRNGKVGSGKNQSFYFIFNIRSCEKFRLTSVYPHVVLVVGGTGEWPSTAWLRAVVRPLPGVCSDVNFADVGGGKRPAATFNRAFKRLLSCRQETGCQGLRSCPSVQFKSFIKTYCMGLLIFLGI